MWWTINKVKRTLYKDGWNNRKPFSKEYKGSGVSKRASKYGGPIHTLGVSYEYGGYPVHRSFTTEEAVEQGVSGKEYEQSKGVQIVTQHPIFEGTGLTVGTHYGIDREITRVELDGARSLNRFTIAVTKAHCRNQNGQPIRDISIVNDIPVGRSRVISWGSIGFYRCLATVTGQRILNNAIRILAR
jgi:hypothetical protein